MGSRSYYQIVVRHPGLHKQRVIRGDDRHVVETAPQTQMRAWNEQYAKKLESEEKRRDRETRRQELEDIYYLYVCWERWSLVTSRAVTALAAPERLERSGLRIEGILSTAMQVVPEVLPAGAAYGGIDLPTDVAGAGNDFEALEALRRLAFTGGVKEPKQLGLWK